MRYRRIPTSLAYLVSATLVGCASPLENRDSDLLLLQHVERAIARELDSLPDDQRRLEPMQPAPQVEEALADRLDELAALGPRLPFDRPQLDLGRDTDTQMDPSY